MKEKAAQIGIIINKKAGNRQTRESTLGAVNALPDSEIYRLEDLENGKVRNIPPAIVIVGGDGTVRACLSWLASHDEYPQILIPGGGSTNIFKSALIREGAETSIKTLRDGDRQKIDYKPAVIEHEDGRRDGVPPGSPSRIRPQPGISHQTDPPAGRRT